jgi:iron complex transport system substrate-binding protein
VTLLAASMLLVGASCGGGNDNKGSRTSSFEDNPTPIQGVSTAAAFPVTVQRSDGKALTVAQPPKRIVSLSPGATEIIYAIGAQQSLAAVDKQANFPEAAAQFPAKVDAFEPNVEAITALNPDLVIVAGDTSGLIAKLDSLNIPVLYQDINEDIRTIDDVMGQIRVLGQITGNDQNALALISSLGERVSRIKEAMQGLPSQSAPNVYHELDSTYFSASDDTVVGDVYRILKMKNIAGDGGGVEYPQLTQEAILAANPRIIVLADEAFGVSIDSVKARPGARSRRCRKWIAISRTASWPRASSMR